MTTPSHYAADRTEQDGIPVVRLSQGGGDAAVCVVPSLGNMAYKFSRGGEDYLYFPFDTLAQFRSQPALCGIPFLGPWANRLDDDAYWANGRHYRLNPDLENLRRDAHHKPIHGLLNFSPLWELQSAGADAACAWTTSRLSFTRHPALMAQFPFAHTVTMTHRLSGGILEVETTLENHSADPMPVAIGYHPYFRLPGVPRDRWDLHLAARDHLPLDPFSIPTGERRPIEFPDPCPLADRALDDVFANLIRDPDGRAHFWVQGGDRRLTVTYGPKYTVAVIYAPAGKDFVCFEPMAAVTNAFNLAHAGRYDELQSVPPGAVWRESFWIQPNLNRSAP